LLGVKFNEIGQTIYGPHSPEVLSGTGTLSLPDGGGWNTNLSEFACWTQIKMFNQEEYEKSVSWRLDRGLFTAEIAANWHCPSAGEVEIAFHPEGDDLSVFVTAIYPSDEWASVGNTLNRWMSRANLSVALRLDVHTDPLSKSPAASWFSQDYGQDRFGHVRPSLACRESGAAWRYFVPKAPELRVQTALENGGSLPNSDSD
jgi:hypothetical protein